jgi:uncharacterized protein YciI
MKYLVIAHDGKDSKATERRLAVREQHLVLAEHMYKDGKSIIGGAILDDNGNMVGSGRIVDFQTRSELDEWLKNEPYVTGNVWERVEVFSFRIAEIYDIGKPKTHGSAKV